MKIAAMNFDLRNTIEAGQIFNYSREGNYYYIIHNRSVIKIRQLGNTLELFTHPRKKDVKTVEQLLNYDKNYLPIMKKYFSNARIRKSYGKFAGVKIAQLEPWECMLGFLCSQMNNIPRIGKMISCLSRNFGEKVIFDGKAFYLFPEPKVIAHASRNKLQSCNLGYREKYILHAARALAAGFQLEKLHRLPYADAKRGLMMLFGIGEKVADCILLFSLGFTEPFPVDVWIKRIMQKMYFKGRNVPEKKVAAFARSKFGKDAGIVHEFIYANRHALSQ